MLLAIFSDRIPILARDLMGARTDFVRPGALWTALTIEEYEAMRAHVRGNDFPETTSQWYSLGREAGFGRVRELFVAPTDLFRMYCFQA
jgi:hypothetical protein